MAEKVTKLAVVSRVIVLLLQLLCNHLLTDHEADVFRSPHSAETLQQNATSLATWLDKTVHFCLGGLRHWDGEYFLHIAEHTYTYENTLAFYPLYPQLVRAGAHALHALGLGVSLRSWCLLVAVTLNVFCFCKAANALYNLTQRVFNDSNKSWNAALLFCFNPASIFFTAAYSEALFCWISLYLMLECVSEQRFVRTTAALALSIITRSNGFLNLGFPIYFSALRRMFNASYHHVFGTLKLLLCLIGALVPLTFFNLYAFRQFCLPENPIEHSPAIMDYARTRNYILAGHRQAQNSPWCDKTFPFPYSYIQSHYWGVGFLRYYELKQLPNFLLALPVLSFLFYHCYNYLKYFLRTLMPKYPLSQLVKEYKSLPFVLHALLLTAFCSLFVHIQVSTRLLCSASPCLFWFAADHLPRTFDQIKLRSKAGGILLWFGSYYLVGTAMFSNNYPWT